MAPATTRSPRTTTRIAGLGATIFGEMTQRAIDTGSVNLGQGAPDTDGPVEILRAAQTAIDAGLNQYPPAHGLPVLREAIAAHNQRFYGRTVDPATEVLVTVGATEAITAAMLAFVEPGDEVIVLEPFYDSYAAAVQMAGGVLVPVTLQAPDYRLDPDALAAAVTDRTVLILLNTPNNPTGRVLALDEIEAVADVARDRDLLVVTDEVYEHLTFDGARHHQIACLPGMAERTVTCSSGGKTFSVTGWKIGWVIAPRELVDAVYAAKQFMTFTVGGPFQSAVATALGFDDDFFAGMAARLQSQRDILVDGLRSVGFTVAPPQGTYFVTTDVAELGFDSAVDFCRDLPERVGVVAIPMTAFYGDPATAGTRVRWAFCKVPSVLTEGVARLRRLAS